MASAIKKEVSEHGRGVGISSEMDISVAEMEDKEQEDEEEELFEINLEAVDNIPPPHYWDAFFTSTSNALLANCLLPISDLSSAIPTVSTDCSSGLSREGRSLSNINNIMVADQSLPMPATGKFFGIKFMGAFGIQVEHKDIMRA